MESINPGQRFQITREHWRDLEFHAGNSAAGLNQAWYEAWMSLEFECIAVDGPYIDAYLRIGPKDSLDKVGQSIGARLRLNYIGLALVRVDLGVQRWSTIGE